MPRRVIIWLASALLLSSCGGAPGPRATSPASTASPAATASPAPTASAPSSTATAHPRDTSRRGRGAADDINGDGRADLVVQVDAGGANPYRLAVLYGSRGGLDPGRRTLIPSGRLSSGLTDRGFRADLDGDGFGDLLAYGGAGEPDDRPGPRLFWGGPHGIDPAAPPAAFPLPAVGGAGYRAAAGDFDGDGAADVAMSSPPANLTVMYGPFSRQGVPARQTVQPSPTGEEFWRMAVDEIGVRHATGLLVYEGDDGEQTAGWLLEGGRGGLSAKGRRLNEGMAAAFGDFDGDGTRDVAVGDDGSRNDEPGYETEPPTVDSTLTVYYGGGRTRTFKGLQGAAVSGDFNGDGRDDLAFGGGYAGGRPVRLFWGAPGGLRPGTGITGLGPAAPLASGDYDGDGDDELVLTQTGHGFTVITADGRNILNRFTLPPS
ncbi:hypothetical protein GBF35_31045 [Nonomuraea phyllanthi]|uniref:FG-GAP repeat domain-containing protein n=1 Tax=Nonomuraea phyllanthi TaxID=2219224 RepID=UPI00129416BB|nr:VCBS repeat-containing protein [Nonomuraea phyllanthi]QFY10457.1 hypothetical protein GBF35_31045 [Nonomuraea phyllanthi]